MPCHMEPRATGAHRSMSVTCEVSGSNHLPDRANCALINFRTPFRAVTNSSRVGHSERAGHLGDGTNAETLATRDSKLGASESDGAGPSGINFPLISSSRELPKRRPRRHRTPPRCLFSSEAQSAERRIGAKRTHRHFPKGNLQFTKPFNISVPFPLLYLFPPHVSSSICILCHILYLLITFLLIIFAALPLLTFLLLLLPPTLRSSATIRINIIIILMLTSSLPSLPSTSRPFELVRPHPSPTILPAASH